MKNRKSVVCLLLITLTLIACQRQTKVETTSGGLQVFIAQVAWVKMVPKQNNKLIISNSCGNAEINFKVNSSEYKLAKMTMGEWCETPFQVIPRDLVVVLDSDNRLVEIYDIGVDEVGNEIIDLMSYYVKENSVFWSLLKELPDGILFKESYDESSSYFDRLLELDVLYEVFGKLYLNKVVYVADIRTMYRLK